MSGTGESSPRLRRFLPFLQWWPRVNRTTTRADVVAGFTGALLGLPQGVAFALLAGLPPEYGLYAAMIPPALSALFGSSRHMIAGPTNAVAILLFASLGSLAVPGSPDYISLVLTVTLLTGIFELAMGIARLGGLVNFISHTVIIGFSTGAAILIAVPAGAAAQSAVHRLKGRVRDIVVGYIRDTVTSDTDLRAEVAEFVSLLS